MPEGNGVVGAHPKWRRQSHPGPSSSLCSPMGACKRVCLRKGLVVVAGMLGSPRCRLLLYNGSACPCTMVPAPVQWCRLPHYLCDRCLLGFPCTMAPPAPTRHLPQTSCWGTTRRRGGPPRCASCRGTTAWRQRRVGQRLSCRGVSSERGRRGHKAAGLLARHTKCVG